MAVNFPFNSGKISAMTRRICDKNGRGHQVVVWANGLAEEAASEQDCRALLHSDGSQEVPVARFTMPTPALEVAVVVNQGVLSKKMMQDYRWLDV